MDRMGGSKEAVDIRIWIIQIKLTMRDIYANEGFLLQP